MENKKWEPRPFIEGMTLSEFNRLSGLRIDTAAAEHIGNMYNVSLLTMVPYSKGHHLILYRDEAEQAIQRILNERNKFKTSIIEDMRSRDELRKENEQLRRALVELQLQLANKDD
ncbi:hypothetical protein V757_03245 [Pelistega indica]|uniref:Uncharacterized protein n=1 Tax=Pelistega indica TaxID=1414851 RepID=V8G9J0_9BURK|nr:hypothetical protein [Pelistega indica]ETD72603.1 hypothetical protein V757_03245 [Pelistega indica]